MMKKIAALFLCLFLLPGWTGVPAEEQPAVPEAGSLAFPSPAGEDFQVFTGNDGEQYDLFEIRKLFFDGNHRANAVYGIYERIAEEDGDFSGKTAENGEFTYDLAPDCRIMMINPETWDLLDPYVEVPDLFSWYIDAFLGWEAPQGRELVFQCDLPEEDPDAAEADFTFITTRIRLNGQDQIEYMEYLYVPWG